MTLTMSAIGRHTGGVLGLVELLLSRAVEFWRVDSDVDFWFQ